MEEPIPALPLGFSMALAQDPEALEAFAAMSKQRKRLTVEQARGIYSREEMRAFTERLAEGAE